MENNKINNADISEKLSEIINRLSILEKYMNAHIDWHGHEFFGEIEHINCIPLDNS